MVEPDIIRAINTTVFATLMDVLPGNSTHHSVTDLNYVAM